MNARDTFSRLQPTTPPSPQTFFGIQALRGVAAIAVVVHHSQQAIQDYRLGALPNLNGGAAGVDIFFAISGFIMVYTTAKLWGKAGAWSHFLVKRLIRIAPLYWIFTLLKMGGIVAGGGIVRYTVLTWPLVAGSFLFIPVFNPGHGHVVPLLVVGWTLCYEMFFYVILAICLAVTKRPVPWLLAILGTLAGASFFRTPAWGDQSVLIDLLLLEFMYGILVALAVRAGRLLSPAVAVAVIVIMGAILAASPYLPVLAAPVEADSDYRAFYWGVPGALILYAVISLERFAKPWVAGLPLLLGDASYSIYLIHAFVLALLGAVWAHFHWVSPAWAWGLVGAGVVGSCAGGVVVHWIVEKPIIDFLHAKLTPRREGRSA